MNVICCIYSLDSKHIPFLWQLALGRVQLDVCHTLSPFWLAGPWCNLESTTDCSPGDFPRYISGQDWLSGFVPPRAVVSFPCLCSWSSSWATVKDYPSKSFLFCEHGQPFGQCSCQRTVFFFFFFSCLRLPFYRGRPPRRARLDSNTVVSIVLVVNDSAPPFLFFSVFQFHCLLYGVRKWLPRMDVTSRSLHLGWGGHIWVEEAINWMTVLIWRNRPWSVRNTTCTDMFICACARRISENELVSRWNTCIIMLMICFLLLYPLLSFFLGRLFAWQLWKCDRSVLWFTQCHIWL